LVDIAKDISPKSALQGIDTESRLFPQKPADANITFFIASTSSLPRNWSGCFDIVHQRLLRAALTDSEWVAVIKEFYRVLQPEGWAQLTEPGRWTAGTATECLQELIDRLFPAPGLSG
jgi:ubiquinone/menaquinone biosynthesis C-methylase UbiE